MNSIHNLPYLISLSFHPLQLHNFHKTILLGSVLSQSCILCHNCMEWNICSSCSHSLLMEVWFVRNVSGEWNCWLCMEKKVESLTINYENYLENDAGLQWLKCNNNNNQDEDTSWNKSMCTNKLAF